MSEVNTAVVTPVQTTESFVVTETTKEEEKYSFEDLILQTTVEDLILQRLEDARKVVSGIKEELAANLSQQLKIGKSIVKNNPAMRQMIRKILRIDVLAEKKSEVETKTSGKRGRPKGSTNKK